MLYTHIVKMQDFSSIHQTFSELHSFQKLNLVSVLSSVDLGGQLWVAGRAQGWGGKSRGQGRASSGVS